MSKKTFVQLIGVKHLSSKRGFCKVKLDLKASHLNYGGIAHGGVIATLCDIALAGAVESVLREEEWCVTAQLDVQFMNPAFPKKPVFAYGKLIRRGSTLAFVEGGVETRDKTQIARANGIWAIKSRPTKKIKSTKRMD